MESSPPRTPSAGAQEEAAGQELYNERQDEVAVHFDEHAHRVRRCSLLCFLTILLRVLAEYAVSKSALSAFATASKGDLDNNACMQPVDPFSTIPMLQSSAKIALHADSAACRYRSSSAKQPKVD